MSAALLQKRNKSNELEDDRESCLHVLTWTALRFTDYTLLEGCRLKTLLRPFDEAYEDKDGVKGGELKEGSLLGRHIPKRVKFDSRPHLDELIAVLTKTFAVRYEETPSKERFERLEEMEKSGLYSSNDLAENTVFQYKNRISSLKERSWLVKTFRSHLDAGCWPTSDIANKQLIDGHRGKRRKIG